MTPRIKFDGSGDNDEVHFIAPAMDYTLCGITLDGDLKTAGGFSSTREKVNCIVCIRLINYCKNIKTTEYAKNII